MAQKAPHADVPREFTTEDKMYVLSVVYGLLCEMERDGETSVMTVNGPASPSAVKKLVLDKYAELSQMAAA